MRVRAVSESSYERAAGKPTVQANAQTLYLRCSLSSLAYESKTFQVFALV